MHNQNINIGIQVIPKRTENGVINGIVETAINTIKKAGVTYHVSPFETILEGPYDKLMQVIKEVQENCMEAGADDLVVNIRIHHQKGRDADMLGKMHKYG